jgi:hypothetical protein
LQDARRRAGHGGLAPTDLVITGGAYGLDDGTKVKVGAAADDDKKPSRQGGEGLMAKPGSAGKRLARKPFWLARSTRTIFFFAACSLAGVYLAFPGADLGLSGDNFPRVVIGVDNGVMPVEQMQVTITKPIEDAVNAVPGLKTVRSTTSRGSAEISLFFDWNQDMFHSLQLVDAALSKVEQTLPSTAKMTTNRLTFATFPILGYSLTSDTVPQTRCGRLPPTT